MITRLLASVFATLALQLNVNGISASCDMTADAPHAAVTTVHEDATDHGANHSAPTTPASVPQHQDCDSDSPCCVAASCSSTSIHGAIGSVTSPAPLEHVTILASHTPHSRITTPDPPPPKA